LLGVLLAVIIVGGISTTWHKAAKPGSRSPSEAISQPIPTPQPSPPVVAPAPRAALVKLPDHAPRAQLIRLPEWRFGEQRLLTMPSGIQTLGTLRGRLLSEDALPQTGYALGDTFVVGDNAWTWLVAPNSASAQWIDP
jgi:hypothetical protein